MTRIAIQGHVVEVPIETAISWTTFTILSSFQVVAPIYWGLSYAIPGRAAGDLLRMLLAIDRQLQGALAALDDTPLIECISRVLPPLQRFLKVGLATRAWQLRHVPKSVKATHNKATRQHGPVDPPWRFQEGFLHLLDELTSAFSDYLVALEPQIPVLRRMLPLDAEQLVRDQVERSLKAIPDLQAILTLGYGETARRKAAEMGYLPSA